MQIITLVNYNPTSITRALQKIKKRLPSTQTAVENELIKLIII